MKSDTALMIGWEILAGSGVVVGVLLLALVERLRRTFATRQDLEGLRGRVDALETLYVQTRDLADDARDRLGGVVAQQRHQWERVAEQVIKPLERITDKLETVSESQSAQRAVLAHIGKGLDRAEERRPRAPPQRP